MTKEKLKNSVTVSEATESKAVVVPQPTAPMVPAEPETELWSYMGTDNTGFTDIAIVSVEDEDRQLIKTWMGKIKKTQKGQKISYENDIQEGISLIKSISCEANKLINIANRNFADRAISIGMICHRLKQLIRGDKRPWAVWAEENLPFIAKRNREKYMLLASRPDCWPFSFLGVDRLEMLCSVTKDIEGTNRIGDLFKKYEIPYDENMEISMGEFKTMIDAAINHERLVNNGLTINFNLVTNIVNLGVDFDKALIQRMKDVRDCGGNPENLLQKIALTGGKEDTESSPEKRLQDFNHLSNRLIKTLDFIVADQNQLAKIDRDTFRLLIEKLASIQELGILNEDEEKAA